MSREPYQLQSDDGSRNAIKSCLEVGNDCSGPVEIIQFLIDRGELYKGRVITELFWEHARIAQLDAENARLKEEKVFIASLRKEIAEKRQLEALLAEAEGAIKECGEVAQAVAAHLRFTELDADKVWCEKNVRYVFETLRSAYDKLREKRT